MDLKFWHRSPSSRLIKGLWRDADGAALVEATVLTPLLIVLFFGVFEFSWYFYNQQLVEIGVRDAARYLARGPYVSVASTEGTDPCLDATNRLAAQNLAVTGSIDGTGSVRVKGWTAASVNIDCPSIANKATYAGPDPIYRVRVQTSFPDPTLGYFGMLGLGIPNLSSSHIERSFGSG
jgi:zona occludens toxin (predicted ATPase)